MAVCSDVDRFLAYTGEADQTVCVGGQTSAESYLDIAKIISAARATRVDAIHPGYGFLAESPDFAEACIEAGFIFVGPSPQAIRAMGSKTNAKELAELNQVPLIPGAMLCDDEGTNLGLAEEVGFPLLVKASAGGGGRGMRLVEDGGSLNGAIRAAGREALAAFGDASIFIERYLQGSRHIEVQIVADRFGEVVHLGDRDCSLQRRHQKLIEEAPAPDLGPDLQAAMRDSAIRLGKAIDYEGVGTVEFLVSGAEYFFLEMNTRLQVEHPVTEAVTGLDLVELQLRIAAGEKLAFAQDDVIFDGHAIEARLCAEDPSNDFSPSGGEVIRMAWASGPGTRVEATYGTGDHVSSHYDSLVAKVIVHSSDRETSRRLLAKELRHLVVHGPLMNRDLLIKLLDSAMFDSGAATTSGVEEATELTIQLCGPSTEELLAVACLAFGTDLVSSPQLPARRNRFHFELDSGQRLRLEVSATGNELELHLGRSITEVQVVQLSDTECRLSVDGIDVGFAWHRDRSSLWVNSYSGQRYLREIAWDEADEVEIDESQGVAPVQGTVLEIVVVVGDSVDLGDKLLTLESMKMEHIVKATRSGTINAVLVEVGAQVAAGSLLVTIQE